MKHNYCPNKSVTRMFDGLGWRSLENRRTDGRLIMFHRIIYGYVAIQVPSYFERPEVLTRHTHPLAFGRIHTYASYYQHSFYPAAIVLWNKLRQSNLPSVTLSTEHCFNLLLNFIHSALAFSFFFSCLTFTLFIPPTMLLLFLHCT